MWVRIELPSEEARQLFGGRPFVEGNVPYVRTIQRAAMRLYNGALPPGSPRRRSGHWLGEEPKRVRFAWQTFDGEMILDPECLVFRLVRTSGDSEVDEVGPQDDPQFMTILQWARDDSATLGLILHGSRGARVGDEESDYDLIWVLTDPEYERRSAAGEQLSETTYKDGRKLIEIDYTCPSRLADPAIPRWITQGLATAQILLDKSGEVGRALSALVSVPGEQTRREAGELFDGYLNGFYRSMKAGRRGNELGARLQAAESLVYLIRTLFALEGRWPPFHDRLTSALDTLGTQGWEPGELHAIALEIMRTGDPRMQIRLEKRVEALLRERGHGSVIDAWNGEIERVRDQAL